MSTPPSKQNRQSTAAAGSASAASSSSSSGSNNGEDDFVVHPTSKWQEPMREDELTLWEVHRKPRKLIDNQINQLMIRCPLKMLNPEFRCVICLGYLKNTTMVMVCVSLKYKENDWMDRC
jgi:E3 ubiquitin-protein ligase RNF1/2